MLRRWNVFPFFTTMLTNTPCLEKSSKDSNKIYQLFARIPYDNTSIWWFQESQLLWVSTSANLDPAKSMIFQKKTSLRLFLLSLESFFRIDIKSNSWWIAQKMSSKKVKQVLQRKSEGAGVAMELHKKTKWTRKETLL